VKETIQEAAAVYYNTGTNEWHSKPTKPEHTLQLYKAHSGNYQRARSPVWRNNTPFELFCYSILLC